MVRLLRTLGVDAHPEEGRDAHVSSGSSLVICGRWAYVAIDDELHIGAFDMSQPGALGQLLRVLPGSLPLEPGARKAAKPDLESLFLLDRELVGVPSGSTAHRIRGFAMPLSADGSVAGQARGVDWSPLLEELDAQLDGHLNVEGAIVRTGELLLLLRSSLGANAVATADLEPVSAGIATGRVGRGAIETITTIALPELGGIPLGFTDAALLDDQLLFSAAAEETDDPYDDGRVTGSAIGQLDGGTATILVELPEAAGKVEGLHCSRRDGAAVAHVVTDDDDASRPSRMYELTVPVSGRT